MTEGIDYSATPPGGAAIKGAGKVFVCRYLATDWRGITAEEVNDLKAHGIEIAVVYESLADRAAAGWNAGVEDAQFAQSRLAAVGLPLTMPIYFVGDDTDDQYVSHAAIDGYLRGAASVIGSARVGVYGGIQVTTHCRDAGTARWFWQTYAWSGGQVMNGVHLLQYLNGGITLNGTSCDLDRSYQENYGQASKFIAQPFPRADLPPWWNEQVASSEPHDDSYNGQHWMVARRNVSAIANTFRYTKPDIKSPKSGPPIKTRDKIQIERVIDLQTTDAKGKKKTVQWLVTRDGDYVFGGRFSPRVQIRHR